MATKSANYQMADRLVRGRLDEILTRYNDQGLSSHTIAAKLLAEHDIPVTAPTVVNWLRYIEREKAS